MRSDRPIDNTILAQPRKPAWGVTLIIAPNTLLGQWEDEIRKFAPRLKVLSLYGRKPAATEVVAADVLLTTPGCADQEKLLLQQPIHRLFLDEAHTHVERVVSGVVGGKGAERRGDGRPVW